VWINTWHKIEPNSPFGCYKLSGYGRENGPTMIEHLTRLKQVWVDLNDAGRMLYTRHPWSWRLEGPVALPVVANQDYIDLPLDFAQEVDSYVPSLGTFGFLNRVTIDEIVRLRRNTSVGITAGTMFIYYPAWSGGQVAEDGPSQRALLYPTPVTDATPTIQLLYNRRWRDIDTGDEKAIPNIPDEFQRALYLAARTIAWHVENPENRMPFDECDAEIERLASEDFRRQSRYGPMRGGASSRYWRGRFGHVPNGLATLS